MGDFYLALLGPPEVCHADQVLQFSTRKELALLIYLAVEGRVHLRKKLSQQFWPKGDTRSMKNKQKNDGVPLMPTNREGVANPFAIYESDLTQTKPQPVRWLWQNRLPLAGITLLGGPALTRSSGCHSPQKY